MPNRSRDWFEQGVRDFGQAELSRDAGRHEWACFAAQQGAEKAVKALHLAKGQEAWGHMVADLLRELPEEVSVPEDMMDAAQVFDNYYIPTRCPNSHPKGAPFERFGSVQSRGAIEHARQILEFARSQMA